MPSDAVVTLVVDATGAQAEADAQLRTIINTAERNAPPITLNVTIDNRTVNGDLNQITNHLNQVGDGAGRADNNVSRLGGTFSRFGSAALSAVTSAARIGAIGSLAAASLPAVAGLAATLAQIAPAAAAGATAFLGLKAATLSLKVGLIGVEDALGQVFAAEPDAEALAKALERLAPEARSFVLEMQKLRPALDDIRLDVQNRLFRDLDTQLKNTATVALPVLRKAAIDFAGTFNTVGRNVASAAQDVSESGALGRALRSSGIAFNNLARIPGQVLTSIVKLAVGGGPLLIRLTDRIADVADSLTNRLDKAAESGALKKAVDEAAATIRQLGSIAGNVFGALGNVMDIAADAGGGLFGSLEKVTQALEDLTATDSFRETLTALITTGQTLISNILPLLQRAFEIIGPIIAEIAPPVQDLINLIGDRLLSVLDDLAPSFETFGSIVSNLLVAVTPLVELFFTLIDALLPFLNPLLEGLNEIIVELTPVIETLAKEFAEAVVPAIEKLLPIFEDLIDFVVRMVEELTPLIIEVLPLVIDLFAKWLSGATFILEKLEPLIEAVLELAAFLTEKLVEALIDVIGWVKDLAAKYEELVGKTIERILKPALQSIVDLLNGDYRKAWEGAKNVAVTAGIGMATSVRETLNGIRDQFRDLSIKVPLLALQAFDKAADAIAGSGPNLARGAARVFGIMRDRIDDFNEAFYRAGQQLIVSLAAGIVSRIGDAVSAMGRAVSAVSDLLPHSPAKRGPFSGRGYPLYSGHAIMDALAAGISARADTVSGAMQAALSGAPLGSPTGVSVTGTSNPFTRAVAGALSTTVAAPNVSVYLGNELLTDRMRVVVDDRLTDRDRQASQGVRF